MQTPGLHHVILTVSDIARAKTFYGDLLGFELKDYENGFYFFSGDISFWFYPSVKPIANDRFSEFRIGLDHLGFAAPSEEALHELAKKLIAAGVETKGDETFHTGNRYV